MRIKSIYNFRFNFVSESVTVMKQQYFRKEPVSRSAAVGSNVTLECEVESRSGFVQWTKDGYALGKNYSLNIFTYVDPEACVLTYKYIQGKV